MSNDDPNPDIIPQENSNDEYGAEENAFDRLNIDNQRILFTPTPTLNLSSPANAMIPTIGYTKQVCFIHCKFIANKINKKLFLFLNFSLEIYVWLQILHLLYIIRHQCTQYFILMAPL